MSNPKTPLKILTLGGPALRNEADLPSAVHEVYREWRAGNRVLAVASGLAGAADDLLKRAQQLGLPPQRVALASLLATGHKVAASLLALALDRAGLTVNLFDPHEIGLVPDGDPLESEPARVDLPRLNAALERGVVVVPALPSLPSPPSADRTARFLARALKGSRGFPAEAPPAGEPLRVALLGCGTVGGGVLARLLAQPGTYRVIGVAVRDLARVRTPAVPRRLLTQDPISLVERDADVVVELLGGLEPARGLIDRALQRGRHVVTANKALLARDIDHFSRLADREGVTLRFSASVGGALPALEAVRRAAASGPVRAVSGVLNGTCNFVLDRCALGSSFEDAVSLAQAAGYAEADPTLDLDGSDAAQKLALLAREAFGADLPWATIDRRGITATDGHAAAEAARRGRAVRLVASCERTSEGLRVKVQPLELPPAHPFASAAGAGNILGIEMEDGNLINLAARGAGRWPTAESVLADLHDLAMEHAAALPVAEIEEGVA
ncbi:MAG: homoserine dehydrogenase [Thermoanaerobaculia bacterium]